MSIVNRCGEGFVGQLHSGPRHRANISMMHIAAVVGKFNAVLCQTVFIVAHEVRLPGATASAAACLGRGAFSVFRSQLHIRRRYTPRIFSWFIRILTVLAPPLWQTHRSTCSRDECGATAGLAIGARFGYVPCG